MKIILLVLSPKKEPKLKTSKSGETKDEFLDNIPNIVENKANSYILMQVVRISIKNKISFIFTK